jgi:Ca-activated chloride channel family protein
MKDPLDDLKSAMDAATPPSDSTRRAENVARAQEIFARHQGSATPPRHSSDRPKRWAGIMTGVRQMFATLATPRALTATTALVACVVFVALPDTRALLLPSLAPQDATAAPPMRERAVAPYAVAPDSTAASEGSADMHFAPLPSRATAPPAQREALHSKAGARAVGAMTADAPVVQPEADTEAFANDDPNPVKITSETPVSTFSIDVDTASYGVVRSSILSGVLPPPEAVRVEEMINYFPYAYPAPDDGTAFRPTVSLMETPWNSDTRLLRIGLQGALPAIADRPPLNLVFLIDTSGSMQGADRLGLLKQSFRLMLGQLRPEDEVAIVTYAGSAGQVLDPTPASDRATIIAALDRLEAGGSTAGQAGLQQAYATAASMAQNGDVSRILLATDGDFNVGLADPKALERFIADKRDSGTYLSVLGFGRGNLDDATMQALAQSGNGQAAYIDTLAEAQKVLVDQLTGALFPIANDVKIQVEFNPATVAEYRLIGYETRALRREDFNNDKVDAGEIGAGHSVTALYEITPVGSPAVLSDPRRYGTPAPTGDSDEIGLLRLRSKAPGRDTSTLSEIVLPTALTAPDDEARFAAAIAGFGQVLRGSDYLGDWTLEDAIALAVSGTGDDPFGYRREAVNLMRLAQSLKN